MFKTTVSFCICAAMVLSAVNFLGTVPAGEQKAAVLPTSEHPLGGLWNPEGPRESATTHLISPASVLSDHPEPRPLAVDNSAGLPPVGNQQTQGSCTAWAIGYYHATYIENREHPFDLTDPANQISPAFLYNVANGGYNGGSFMEDVADLLISNGACSMADMPYNTADYTSWPSEDWKWVSGMKHRAISQNWLDLTDPHGMDALKVHLAAGNTATTGIDVWGNFDDIESYNYTYCSSEVTGSNRGGHIVAIIGYDDDKPTADGKGAFRMVNSWGTGWGEAGFWWMSYEAIVDGVLGYGMAMYLESELNYTPKMVAKASIYHDARGDIVRDNGLELSIFQNESTPVSKPFLSCYWIENWYGTIQPHPFPEGRMAFDISEFIPYMDPLADCEFDMLLYNQGSATGDLATFEVLNSERWEGGIGEGLPMTIEPFIDNYAVAFTVPGTFAHYPIRADGDLGMARRAIGEMWEGDGTPGNPYLIHDYIINGTDWGNCIYVGNTTSDFEISGCQANYASSSEWSDYHADSGILLYSVSSGVLRGNRMDGNLIGAYIWNSTGILAENNSAALNTYGILVSICSNSVLRMNNISDNIEYGALIETSNNVSVYHNNFINNPIQACDDTGLNTWDNGYPSGGNYWLDYVGPDFMSGLFQNIPGSDAIGDVPYLAISGGMGAQDNYPLMEPFIGTTLPDTTPPVVLSTGPYDRQTGVPHNISIHICFSESMNITAAESAFSIIPPVNGSFAWDGSTMIFLPDNDLDPQTEYQIRIDSLMARDLAGNLLDGNGNGQHDEGNTWHIMAPMPTARQTLTISVLNDRIYAIGGRRSQAMGLVEIYDIANDSWSTGTPMPTPRSGLGSAVINNKIYAVGGFNSSTGIFYNRVEEYDPLADVWTQRAPLSVARRGVAVCAVNNRLFAMGGQSSSFYPVSLVEEYDPVNDIWVARAPMPYAAYYAGSVAVNGRIYVVSGGVKTTQEYDPVNNTWAVRSPPITNRVGLGAASVNGKVYAIGGGDTVFNVALSQNEEFNPLTNTLSNKASMPTARWDLSMCSFKESVY
ncbi:MAG: NosD domain-containing protein, partial [Thermoplasmata archaeon]|nr:NosD domain-containing protein [Thermoplasmata archaeon]